MGGGERAAEVILRQTLATALAQGIAENDEERTGTGTSNVVHDEVTAGVESEISGRGFGGALLHFMRLGSLSPICVVQVRVRLIYLFCLNENLIMFSCRLD